MADTKKLGDEGERIACEYLVKKGFKILVKNYRISFGEIDIIAKKPWRFKDLFNKNPSTSSGRAIHFIEVKTLESQNPQSIFPEEHVDFKKQRKLRQLAEIWLEKNKFPQDYPYQIDIIGILISQNTNKAEVKYFLNAVEYRYY